MEEQIGLGGASALRPPKSGACAEAEAIRRAQQGDAAAFEQLYQLHSGRVYALCLRMVGNREEAEDLTQEAFLQLFRKIHTYRGEAALSTWLHRMTFNVVLMSRRRKKLNACSLDGAQGEDELGTLKIEIGSPDPALIGLVDRINLQRAIAQLPRGYRQAFELHDMLGLEHREIARILKCSIGNTKSQAHKARMRLRELLEGRRTAGRRARAKLNTRLRTNSKNRGSRARWSLLPEPAEAR